MVQAQKAERRAEPAHTMLIDNGDMEEIASSIAVLHQELEGWNRWNLTKGTAPRKGRLPVEDMSLPLHHFEAAGGLYKWQGRYYATGQSNSGRH